MSELYESEDTIFEDSLTKFVWKNASVLKTRICFYEIFVNILQTFSLMFFFFLLRNWSFVVRFTIKLISCVNRCVCYAIRPWCSVIEIVKQIMITLESRGIFYGIKFFKILQKRFIEFIKLRNILQTFHNLLFSFFSFLFNKPLIFS